MLQASKFPKQLESAKDSFVFKAFDVDQTKDLWALIVSDRHSPERKNNSWPAIYELQDLRDYLRSRDLENSASEENGYLIYWKEQLVGSLHWHSVSWPHRRIELGYWLHFEFEGQGLISKALQFIEKQLAQMGFHRIEITCDTLNIRSRAVAERNGYTLEGILHDHKIKDGVFIDTASYAKIIGESKP